MKVKEILELIVNLTINSSKSEENKQQLNDHPDFEPYALFTRIDRNDKSYITKNDIINFLKDNNITINQNRCTIDLFIEYYDRDFDEKLNFGEFLNFVLNKDQNLIRSKATQRETYKLNRNDYLNKDLEELSSKCFMSDFYLFEYANVKKIEIFNHLNNNNNNQNFLLELFIIMDIDKDGLISCDDISVFLQERKIQICDEELMNFISIYDEDLDGKLNWNEFLFFILPSPINYEYDLSELKQLEGKYISYYQKNNDVNNNINSNFNMSNNNFNFNDSNFKYYNNNNKFCCCDCYKNYNCCDNCKKNHNWNDNYFSQDYSNNNIISSSPLNNNINVNRNFNNNFSNKNPFNFNLNNSCYDKRDYYH